MIIQHSNVTRCAETSFSSMHIHLSDNNRTDNNPSCIHILLGFSSNVAMLFLSPAGLLPGREIMK